MKKGLLTCTAMLCAILFSLTVAHAVVIQAVVPKANLEFNGTTAICSVRITDAGKPISATMELWSGTTLEAIWSERATGRLDMSKTEAGRKGQTYTLKVSCTVNGETTRLAPITKTCP